jgi:hypothetical protein
METISVKKMAAQGDCMFRRIENIPADAEALPSTNEVIVAHSETGHHHSIVQDPLLASVVLFKTKDPLVSYLRVNAPHADVVHQRAWDTHQTLRLLSGDWEIRRQREHVPEGWRRVED